MKKMIILIFVTLIYTVFNVSGQQCDSCCIPDVKLYAKCFKGCTEECEVPCENGTKFGKRGNSYLQYSGDELDYFVSYTSRLNITLDFNTLESNGFIFFGDNDAVLAATGIIGATTDFITLFMRNGFLYAHLMTHPDFGVAVAVSSDKYDDGQYHTVTFAQRGDFVDLCVDQKCAYDHSKDLWIGGVPDTLKAKVLSRLKLSSSKVTEVTGFKGCIDNLIVDGKRVTPPQIQFNTE